MVPRDKKPIHALIGCVRNLCRPATTLHIWSIPIDDLLWGRVTVLLCASLTAVPTAQNNSAHCGADSAVVITATAYNIPLDLSVLCAHSTSSLRESFPANISFDGLWNRHDRACRPGTKPRGAHRGVMRLSAMGCVCCPALAGMADSQPQATRERVQLLPVPAIGLWQLYSMKH